MFKLTCSPSIFPEVHIQFNCSCSPVPQLDCSVMAGCYLKNQPCVKSPRQYVFRNKGAFVNDVTQIWTILNPPPPSVVHLCPRPYTLMSQNTLAFFPLFAFCYLWMTPKLSFLNSPQPIGAFTNCFAACLDNNCFWLHNWMHVGIKTNIGKLR